MILRRISVERYGCFDTAEFEFRRGLNLIHGGNESGKSLLLAALPAALLGVEHGARLRTWGDSLSCRVTLHFEGTDGGVRVARDLESNRVRIEEGTDAGPWRETFAGTVVPGAAHPECAAYRGHLHRLFGIAGSARLRALLDAARDEVLFTPDGRLVDGLLRIAADERPAEPAAPADPAALQAEIAALEAELAADRDEYRRGEAYLAWIRQRWEADRRGDRPAQDAAGRKGKAKGGDEEPRRRCERLLEEMRRQGLPESLPADLPAMFAQAEELRRELAAVQLELTPLQRRRQEFVLPGWNWPLLATLAAAAATGGAAWLRIPWLLALAGGCGLILLVTWTVFLTRLSRIKVLIADLDRQIGLVEGRRETALGRQAELAERFEAHGLPSAPVEMVKLEQLCRRNEELIGRYREACAALGGGDAATAGDRHLRPEELPEAEARLAEFGERLRRREARLAALRDGTAASADDAATDWDGGDDWPEEEFLRAVGQQLDKLTAGRICRVRFDDRRLQVEIGQGRWAAPVSCSRGTVTALALAVRLALGRQAGGRLPLPIDDPLAVLDAGRRPAVLRTMERYAVDHQLLLAACDEELARRAARERWHVIRLDAAAAEKTVTHEEAADAGQLHLL